MLKKSLSFTALFCFCFTFLYTAEKKTPITHIDQLRQAVAKQRDDNTNKKVKFEQLATRKGPRIDGDPVQTKDKKEAS